jgi:hypothetical protein
MNPQLQDAYDFVSSRCDGYGPEMDEAVRLVFEALADGAYETGRKDGISECSRIAWAGVHEAQSNVSAHDAEEVARKIDGLQKS